jgi:hypothetical protein
MLSPTDVGSTPGDKREDLSFGAVSRRVIDQQFARTWRRFSG